MYAVRLALVAACLSVAPLGAQQMDVLKSGAFTTGLLSVAHASETLAVAVGYNGAVVRTADGGQVWSRVTTPVTQTLYSVGVSGGALVAVGAGGVILRSVDGGIQWTPMASGTSRRLSGVAFSGAAGVAVGDSGAILSTEDGGVTWLLRESGATELLTDVAFAPGTSTVTAVGRVGTIVRSDDGGRTWKRQVSGSSDYLTSIAMPNAQNAVAVGLSGALLLTSSAGAVWSRVATPAGAAAFSEVAFTDLVTGVVVGGGGTILRTTNGGMTWLSVRGGEQLAYEGIAFAGTTGSAVGSGGTVMRTSDGGVTWTRQLGSTPAATASAPPAAAPATPASGSLFLEVLGLAVNQPTGSVSWRASTGTSSNGVRMDQLVGSGSGGEQYVVSVSWRSSGDCATFIANLLTQQTGSRLATTPSYKPIGWFSLAVEKLEANTAYLCLPLEQGVLVAGTVGPSINSNGITTVRPALFAIGQAAQRRWGRSTASGNN